MMIPCPSCGGENPETAIFCRTCIDKLENYLIDAGYVDETFDKFRLFTVHVVLENISIEDYRLFLDSLKNALLDSIEAVSSIEAEPELMEYIHEQQEYTLEGLHLYLDAIDTIWASVEKDDADQDYSYLVIEALAIAEQANHFLNQAMEIIEMQDQDADSVVADQLF
ncbi:MAG: hypothetical protein ACLFQV_07700 [Vulcanimicrobiota bacterium]